MLYSKNLGGGHKKRSNRRSFSSKRFRMSGGEELYGILISFDIDKKNLQQVEIANKLTNDLIAERIEEMRYLIRNISPVNPLMGYMEAGRNLVGNRTVLSRLNETLIKKHHIALRNLQRIILKYGIPSFTLYNGIDCYNNIPLPTSIKTTYFANSTPFETYE